jgi:4-hydroxy-4-methyl-2-oxoglutarate aldolase
MTNYRDIPRADAGLLARLQGFSVADLHDALSSGARGASLLDHAVRPITEGARVCGQAVTAFCAPGDSLLAHVALYVARPGDVLVLCNGGIEPAALWGGNMAFDAKALGVAGAVIDAPIRDVGSIRALKFPTWASSVSAVRADKKGVGAVNVPVVCGGKTINPGDVVVADDDGILVFSPTHLDEIADAVSRRLDDEARLRGRIETGQRIFEIAGLDRLLKDRGVAIEERAWNAENGR